MLLSPSVVVKKQENGATDCQQRHGSLREDQKQQRDQAGPSPISKLQG
jgi:hypothetical protein